MAVKFPRDEEGYILDENGERVLPNEPSMSKKTGKRKKAKSKIFTEAKLRKVCNYIIEGNTIKDSLVSAGINPKSYYANVSKMGKKGIEPYATWYNEIEKAKSVAVTDKMHILSEEMKKGNVGVIQWWLSRMHPEQWERTERIKAKIDNSQKIEIVRLSDKTKSEE